MYILHLQVQTTNNLGIPTPPEGVSRNGTEVFSGYRVWLAAGAKPGSPEAVTTTVRGTGLPTSQQVCLNHMLTFINTGSTYGVANTASIAADNIAGGICDTFIFGSGTVSDP